MKFLDKKSQSGFTLVELMVVVAIIGILSAVAIPSFKRYQAKAKTSEAKLSLASIYSAEVSFYSDYDVYAGCLSLMGYEPGAADSRYFTTGFNGAAALNAAAKLVNPSCGDTEIGKDVAFWLAGRAVGSKKSAKNDLKGTGVESNGSMFQAAAAGIISADKVGSSSNSFFKSFEAVASGSSTFESDATVDGCYSDPGSGAYVVSHWSINHSKTIKENCPGY